MNERYEGKAFSQLDAWGRIYPQGCACNFYSDMATQEELFGQHVIKQLEDDNMRFRHFDVLDAGGGDGLLMEALIRILLNSAYRDFQVWNIDKSPEFLTAAGIRKSEQVEPEIRSRWINRKGDLVAMTGIPDNRFDFIVSRMVLQFATGRYRRENNPYPSQESHLKELYRVLKPGGLAIVVWPGARSPIEQMGLQLINSEIVAQIGFGEGKSFEERLRNNLESRSYTDIEFMAQRAWHASFKVVGGDEEKEYHFPIGAKAYWDRFGRKVGLGLDEVETIVKEIEAKYRLIMEPFGFQPEYHPTGPLVYPTFSLRLKKTDV